MILSNLNKVRILFILVAMILMVGHHFLPKKSLVIYPSPVANQALYSDSEWGGESTAVWEDEARTKWTCKLVKSEQYPVCGFVVTFSNTEKNAIDLSQYIRFKMSISSEGPASKLRLYIRNFNAAYSTEKDNDSLKFNYAILRKAELDGREISVEMNELAVADWWLDAHDLPRELSQVELTKVFTLGIDFPVLEYFDRHQVTIHKIELEGEWIAAEKLYLIVIVILLLILCWETIKQVYSLYLRTKVDSMRIRHLTDYASVLEEQSDKYLELSIKDPLTGILNRNGLARKAEDVFASEKYTANMSVLVFDLDHFKKINDNYGHDIGDLVLKSVADNVKTCIRETDTFARWGGEEFILICANTTKESAGALADKIRESVSSLRFDDAPRLRVSVSIGGTALEENETFEDTFKRADQALYDAKESGRNCTIIV